MSKATRIKTFADVDTSSDFDVEDEAPSNSKSAASVTFRTEQTERKSAGAPSQREGRAITESEGSIMFESDSDDDNGVVAAPPAPAPAQAPKVPHPAPPVKTASPLAGLKFAMPVKSAIAEAPIEAAKPHPEKTTQVDATAQNRGTVAPPRAVPAEREPKQIGAIQPPIVNPSPTAPQDLSSSPQPRPPAKTSPTTAEMHHETLSTPSQPARPPPAAASGDDDDEHDSFAEAVLPRGRAPPSERVAPHDDRYNVHIPPVRHRQSSQGIVPTIPEDVNELLVRAQLRLDEKRRATDLLASSTPRRRLPSPRVAGNGAVTTPYRSASAVRDAPFSAAVDHQRSSAVPANSGALTIPSPRHVSLQDDAKNRRIVQENARLVEEVQYLNRENQKLRAATGAVDTAEAMRLQLTVDMLRKEIESRELDRQQEREECMNKLDAADEQLRQQADEAESYASSAQQYKKLYEEKLHELDDAAARYQAVFDQVQTVEHKQRLLEQQHKDRLESERDRAERAVANLQDVKQQRDHLQQLNAQLQLEVQRAGDEKRYLKVEVEKATSQTRQVRDDAEKSLESVREELDRLRQTLSEKEQRHVAQLREEQRQQSALQQRLEQIQAEHDDEVDRLRRTAEAAREDAKRLLREERDRRLQVENELRRRAGPASSVATPTARDSGDAYSATMVSELQRRLKECKAELDQERRARTEGEVQRLQLSDELEHVTQALQYYQQEVTVLSERLAESEQMRDASDSQRALLQSALDELMQHDDQQSQRVAELQAALEDAFSRRNGQTLHGSHTVQAYDAEQLSAENDRLNAECERLASERDQLLEDNGRIAEELLKWKDEMRRFASSYTRSGTPGANRSQQ